MNDFGVLVSEFERAGLKHATRSRVRWWLKQRDVSAAFVELFFKRVLRSGAWEPFEGDKLPSKTREERAGYRDAARAVRTVTLRPLRRTLLITLGMIAILPAWLYFMHHAGRMGEWFAWIQAAIFGIPAFVLGAVRLFRFARPNQIEVHSERATVKRRGEVHAEIHRDEIRFVGVARHTDAEVRSALPRRQRRLGLVMGSYENDNWVMYAERTDGSVLILADHLRRQTARAAASQLEQALELEKRAQVQARVEHEAADESADEVLAAQDDESVAASVQDRADSDVKSTGTR